LNGELICFSIFTLPALSPLLMPAATTRTPGRSHTWLGTIGMLTLLKVRSSAAFTKPRMRNEP
jgi:hypothetical protein